MVLAHIIVLEGHHTWGKQSSVSLYVEWERLLMHTSSIYAPTMLQAVGMKDTIRKEP